MASDGVARGSVLLTPKFENLTSSITSQLESAFSGVSTTSTKAGAKAGAGFSAGVSAKVGAVAGVVSSVASTAFNTISSSLGSAISRVDTLNNFPKVMSSLGYSSEEATASIQKISTSLQGLPSSTNGVASMVQRLAPLCDSLDEATNLGLALNNMMLSSGASTADVSRAMQQYTQMLSKGAVDLQSWRTLQEVMPGQLNQVAQALLGAAADSNDLYTALQSGTLSMDEFNDKIMELNESGGDGFASFEEQARNATNGIATAMDNVAIRASNAVAEVIQAFGAENISGAINSFSSQFSGIGKAFATIVNGAKELSSYVGGKLKTAFEDFKAAMPTATLEGVSAAFEKIKSAIDMVSPAVAPAVTAFMLFLPVATTIGKVVGAIGMIGPALMAVAGGPVGIVVAALAGLVAGFAALYNSSEEVRNAVSTAWAQVQESVQAAWPTIQQAITTASQTLQAVGAVVVQKLMEFWTACQTYVLPVVQAIYDRFMEYWPMIQNFVVSAITTIWNTVQSVWPTVQSIFETACSVISAVVAVAWPVIASVVYSAVNIIGQIIETVLPVVQGIFEAFCTVAATVVNSVWPVIQSVIETCMNVIQSVIETVTAVISGDWEGAWNGLQGIVSSCSGGITDVVQNLIDGIGNILGSLWDVAVNAGKSIIQGLIDGINAIKDSAFNAASDALNAISSLFPHSPAKTGPFSGHGYTTYSGRAMMEGLAQGIGAGSKTALKAATGAMGDVSDAMAAGSMRFQASATATYGAAYAKAQDVRTSSALTELIAAVNERETAVYVDGKKLASTIAKPMNQQLGRLAARGV